MKEDSATETCMAQHFMAITKLEDSNSFSKGRLIVGKLDFAQLQKLGYKKQ